MSNHFSTLFLYLKYTNNNEFESNYRPIYQCTAVQRKPKDNFLSSLGAPARRALEREGIKTLEQLAKYSEKEILSLHGMGKSTLPKLQKLLTDNDLTFKL
jgi:DNA-directed RNA polymerase alpha subunit